MQFFTLERRGIFQAQFYCLCISFRRELARLEGNLGTMGKMDA